MPHVQYRGPTTRQAAQLEVDKKNGKERHREGALVEVYKKAQETFPPVKILQGLKMRNACAQKAIENDG